MGAISEMSKIRCYGLSEVLNMRGVKSTLPDDLRDTFHEYGVHAFQPPTTPGSGRGRRQRGFYLTTNENFDRWIGLNNTCAIIKGLPIAKLKYKEYGGPYNHAGLFEFT